MKVLWITNSIFPAPAEKIGLPKSVFGGWLYGMSDVLSKTPGIELAVATVYAGTELKDFNIDGIRYFLLPSAKTLTYQEHLEAQWQQVYIAYEPEVIHIHGTEYPNGLACMKKLPGLKYVVSIQGLLSVYDRYYLGGLSGADIYKNITVRDIIRRDTLPQAQKEMQKRSGWEKEYFKRTKNIIGRTTWDRVHGKILAPGAQYHFCNESLRETFYTSKKWQFDDCRKHSIFLSQAFYPIKGLHQALKAAALLKSEFPDIRIRVAGPDITRSAGWKDRLRLSGYGRYIRGLIRRHNLEDHVEFTGELSEEKMVAAYLQANVFVCPSMIENSPNSLGEGQILGVPCVAAYVGGVPDMVIQHETGLLYTFEEVEMLADAIRKLFLDPAISKKLSSQGIIEAEKRHNRLHNAQKVVSIYNNLEV